MQNGEGSVMIIWAWRLIVHGQTNGVRQMSGSLSKPLACDECIPQGAYVGCNRCESQP